MKFNEPHSYKVYEIPPEHVESCCPDVVDGPIKCAICDTTIGWGGGDLNCTSFVCVECLKKCDTQWVKSGWFR